MSKNTDTELEAVTSSWAEREDKRRAEDRELQLRALDQQDRLLAIQEQATNLTHHVEGDTAKDRFTVFFDLPVEHRDYRVREVSVNIAASVGGDIEVVLANADRIAAYIRGDLW